MLLVACLIDRRRQVAEADRLRRLEEEEKEKQRMAECKAQEERRQAEEAQRQRQEKEREAMQAEEEHQRDVEVSYPLVRTLENLLSFIMDFNETLRVTFIPTAGNCRGIRERRDGKKKES